MSLPAPPSQQAMIDDESSGFPTFPWIIFFNGLFNGDAGIDWTPNINNMVINGVPEVVGRVYQISKYLACFSIQITPSQDTSGQAGVTYIDNFPLTMNGNGICFAVSGNLGTNSGMCDKLSNRIYPPSWNAVTIPLTILGFVEAS